MDSNCAITDLVTVRNATNSVVTVEGTVTVPAGSKDAIIAAANAAWSAHSLTASISDRSTRQAGAISRTPGRSTPNQQRGGFQGDYWLSIHLVFLTPVA
jgi:hypothetical protein